MTKFFKKSKKTYFRAILGPFFFSDLGKNEFSLKKGLCQFFKYSNYLLACKKSEKTNEPL